MLTVRLLKKNILYKRNIPFYQLLEVIISYFLISHILLVKVLSFERGSCLRGYLIRRSPIVTRSSLSYSQSGSVPW